MSSDPDYFSRYADKTCPLSHPDRLDEDNARWLAQEDRDANAVIRIERVRKQHPGLTLAVSDAVRDDEYRAILTALAQGAGAETYDGIEPFLRASRRTIRRRVNDLIDMGIVDRDEGKPTTIHFPNEAAELLVEDALSMFYSINK